MTISTKARKRLCMIAIEGVFFGSIVTIAVTNPITDMPWWLLVLLPLAAMRAGVTIAENEVMAWLREPFCITAPDSCGAGDSVSPKPNSVFGSLLSCPICSGTWSALVLVGLYALLPSVGTLLILVLGTAGGAEFLYYAKENNAWSARYARVRDGRLERPSVPLFEEVIKGVQERK